MSKQKRNIFDKKLWQVEKVFLLHIILFAWHTCICCTASSKTTKLILLGYHCVNLFVTKANNAIEMNIYCIFCECVFLFSALVASAFNILLMQVLARKGVHFVIVLTPVFIVGVLSGGIIYAKMEHNDLMVSKFHFTGRSNWNFKFSNDWAICWDVF